MSYEAESIPEIPLTMARHGFAIYRGMIDQSNADFLASEIRQNTSRAKHNGALKFSDIESTFLHPLLAFAFYEVLGPYELLNNKWGNTALIAGHKYRGTTWHQEAETSPQNILIAWVNLSEGAGKDCPGLGLIDHPYDKEVDELIRDNHGEITAKEQHLANMTQVYPVLDPGDVVFLDRHTVHKTFITKDMSRDRLSFKLTAVKT